jgi:hypothetical protein
MKLVIHDDNNDAMPSQNQYVQEGQEQVVPLPHQGGGSHPNGQE